MGYFYNSDSKQSDIFRIFDYAKTYATKSTDAKEENYFSDTMNDVNTTYADLAEKSAEDEKCKTGMTKMLEDYTEKYKSLHGENRSNITADDCKRGFWGNIKAWLGKPNDNIFETEEAQAQLKEDSRAYQSTLFKQEIKKNDGIVYAKEGENKIESALNFAKADIAAVEKVYQRPEDGWDSTKGELTCGEINSYTDYDPKVDLDHGFFEAPDTFIGINLDKNGRSISAEEYASYIIAADTNNDGKISGDEAQAVADAKEEDLQANAQKIYDEYFK